MLKKNCDNCTVYWTFCKSMCKKNSIYWTIWNMYLAILQNSHNTSWFSPKNSTIQYNTNNMSNSPSFSNNVYSFFKVTHEIALSTCSDVIFTVIGEPRNERSIFMIYCSWFANETETNTFQVLYLMPRQILIILFSHFWNQNLFQDLCYQNLTPRKVHYQWITSGS